MTRIQQQINLEPEGTPAVGVTVRVRRESDDVSIATLATDSDGLVSYEVDGHPGPFYLHVADVAGGDKFWTSDDAMAVGPLSLFEVPVALSALGDGVIRGYLDELEVAAGTGDTITVATGGALVAGYPVINYNADALAFDRPVTDARIDRVIVSVRPATSSTTPGLASIALLAGTEGGDAPALTQTAELYEVSLAQVEIPVAFPITVTDERAFSGERLDISDIARVSSVTTTSGGEALSGLSVTLVLPRTATYDIAATLTGQQRDAVGALGWQLQATYGPTFNGLALSSPSQVAVDGTGRILVADTGNDRLVILTSGGAYSTSITSGVAGVTGVCVDASDNIYVVYDPGANVGIRKYNSSLVSQWLTTISSTSAVGGAHCTTDGTSLWVAASNDTRVYKRSCSDGSSGGSSFGGAGSTNGKFGAGGPFGITNDGTHLYVGDPGNGRIQKFLMSTSAYVAEWSATPTGLAVDASGNVLRGVTSTSRVIRSTNTGTTIDQFTQTSPVGIAVASGDVLWVSNSTAGTIAKWDEAVSTGGYGQVAIEIDSVVGTYTGIGLRDGAVENAETTTATGPDTIVVRAFGKATADTMTIEGAVLSARATPRR